MGEEYYRVTDVSILYIYDVSILYIYVHFIIFLHEHIKTIRFQENVHAIMTSSTQLTILWKFFYYL